ncbi:hypothetical protein SNEBB_003028 [Seison nebaliae]|nr:hypothetical protein SNEBB_003028 [Seison nebaliae]
MKLLSKLQILFFIIFSSIEVNCKNHDELHIGSFNIQVLGTKKMANADVVDVIIKILRRYDLVLIQEIRDTSDTTVPKLLELLNRNDGIRKYSAVVSPRLGRTNSKEQYAFIFDMNKITVSDSYMYDDGEERTYWGRWKDEFQREPFVVKFKTKLPQLEEFAFIPMHVDPGEATKEIDSLYDVVEDVRRYWNISNILIGGDLNAGCSYVAKYEWSDIRLRNDVKGKWLIGDDADTTTKASECPYDRFIIYGSQLQRSYIENSANVFNYQSAYSLSDYLTRNVSDHYPIEMKLSSNIRELTTTPKPKLYKFGERVKIASFNIQVLGLKKIDDSYTLKKIVKILSRYDLVLVQELRDSTGITLTRLLTKLNEESGTNYIFISSNRLGRSVSKEQYVFIYDPTKFQIIDHYEYDDGVEEQDSEGNWKDTFQREPFIVKFRVKNLAIPDFAFVGLHAEPTSAPEEIDALYTVVEDVRRRWKIEDILIAGDLNAGCGYLPKYKWVDVRLRQDPKAMWLIGDDADTTTKASECAYDRFILYGNQLQLAYEENSAQIFDFKKEYRMSYSKTIKLSDHYPIEMNLVEKFEIIDGIVMAPAPKEKLVTEAVKVASTNDPRLALNIRIGSFKIRSFGESKMRNDDAVEILRKIISRYDICLMEEIRDKYGRAIETFMKKLNENNDIQYEYVISERIGRSSSKEQFAFIYNPNKIIIPRTFQYDDGKELKSFGHYRDKLAFEPFIVEIAFKQHKYNEQFSSFWYVPVNLDRYKVSKEVDYLPVVVKKLRDEFDAKNILLAGDFREGCATDVLLNDFTELASSLHLSRKKNERCINDRFISIGNDWTTSYTENSAQTFDFMKEFNLSPSKANDVSYHIPIEFTIRV